MSQEEISEYRKDPSFRRNEAIYILGEIDGEPLEAARTFDLSEAEIRGIIERHKDYWLSSYYA